MRGKIGDKVRIQHVLDAIQEIDGYIADADFVKFSQNSMMRFACIKQLEIIGESCNHISNDLKDKNRNIQWSQIIAMRNVFIHEYFGVDSNLVWEIIKSDLPDLKEKTKLILAVL